MRTNPGPRGGGGGGVRRAPGQRRPSWAPTVFAALASSVACDGGELFVGAMMSPAGAAGATSQPTGCAGAQGAYATVWRDDFERLDGERWQVSTTTYDDSAALFVPDNLEFSGGLVGLRIDAAEPGAPKPYRGAELRSVEAFSYGRVATRAKFVRGSGLMASLVGLHSATPGVDPPDFGEIDVNGMGRYLDQVHFNVRVTGADGTIDDVPHLSPVPFDPSAGFHDYAFEWTPTTVRYFVDGALFHETHDRVSELRPEQQIVLKAWVSTVVSWSGAIDVAAMPTVAEFDWVEYCEPSG